MPREQWYLARDRETGLLIVDGRGDEDVRVMRDEPISLLALMAADPASGLREIAPGVYRGPLAP